VNDAMEAGARGLRWLAAGDVLQSACPVCGDGAGKAAILVVDSSFAGRPPQKLVRCAACDTLFFAFFPFPSYECDQPYSQALTQYYLEQGAGIDVMLGPLHAIPAESVRSYLEIGCGFGFAVDYASRELGWKVRGVDPSFLAREGKRILELDLELDYWAPRAGEQFDLIYGSEVIEHLADPQSFVGNAARALTERGVLLLTTPNAEALKPDGQALANHAILSPGYHAVLFTPQSLRNLLVRAGLPEVTIWQRDWTLFALASRVPTRSRPEPTVERAAYRRYLSERIPTVSPGCALACGFAYRLFKDCVNRGDYALAKQALEVLAREVQLRFRLSIDAPESFAMGERIGLDAFAGRFPFNLTGTFYFQGMLELNHHVRPARARAYFDAAVRAGRAVRHALQDSGADDGETADLSALAVNLERDAASRCL
jgi:SAM-dependent methyltransferase